MVTAQPSLDTIALRLNGAARAPLHRQLYDAILESIREQRLKPGSRLPSTRVLARALNLSRNTVAVAFDHLMAEGYLEARRGSGTFVTLALPEVLPARGEGGRDEIARPPPQLAARAAAFAAVPSSFLFAQKVRPFRMNFPAVDAFPIAQWARLTGRLLRHLGRATARELLGEGDAPGYRPLREGIANYLGMARGVRCTPDQIVVVAGAQQAIDITVRALLDPGDLAWVEDPGYPGARAALAAAGAVLAPVPVDGEGIDVAAGVARWPRARLAVVCPSKQFPLGVTMSLARRIQLLEWAAQAGAWIVEDDYDSEYRFTGRPLAALQGLDRDGRVIYIGTFSKVMFPSLRVGYVVVPRTLIDVFVGARAIAGRHSPVLEQALVAEFMAEGHFGRHIRRMRRLYQRRHDTLIEVAQRHLRGLVRIEPTDAGLQVVGWLPEEADDTEVAAAGHAASLELAPISRFALAARPSPGLLLGFSAFTEREIEAGARTLKEVLERHLKPRGRHREALHA
jgi:GntR family transcriptional regulator/MocR family aminotransferase